MAAPCPGWLAFDAAAWKLTGTPPADFTGGIDLRFTATYTDAQSATIVATHDVALGGAASQSGEAPSPVDLDLEPADFAVAADFVVTARLANGDVLPELAGVRRPDMDADRRAPGEICRPSRYRGDGGQAGRLRPKRSRL